MYSLPVPPSIKWRNSLLDTLFYDVSRLNAEEQKKLREEFDHEGAIVVVPPGGPSGEIRHYADPHAYLAAEGDRVQALVVAGVGSSALGTAALARSVADAYGIDVAGVVSGYGMADLASEALGGWFFYGMSDAIEYKLRAQLRRWGHWPVPAATLNAGGTVANAFDAALPSSPDIEALEAILGAAPPALRLLVGHSKGCLLLDFVLEQFLCAHEENRRCLAQLKIATFGAVVDLPEGFAQAQQFIGNIDWFGAINSRPKLDGVRLVDGWHHLNRYPLGVDIGEVLRRHVPLQ
ncbi:hypothetical protein [Jeongeupia sp. USM3]|uniref:hypothetical protein n=1 Tax=Jeongeupia sp. USM3 TaxID=1906741 RepID=UPI00089DEED9|nr:hypothetical protein [Jeongeupia sp. USM3]AOY01913.1 hypothetical protein BJP62_16550 [Jeongeupia sp. USM3]